MKYILYQVNGIPTPILFPEHVSHNASRLLGSDGILSAGFCEVTDTALPVRDDGDIEVKCFGASDSLGISSRQQDAEIIGAFLAQRSLQPTV